MLWRHFFRVRAGLAAGLLTGVILGVAAAFVATPVRAEPDDPAPVAEPATQTINILHAKRSGELKIELRGQGQDKVHMVLKNTSGKRLNVVLPPGLVASSHLGQPGGGGGGGLQSMGLGMPVNEPGAFGAFRPAQVGPIRASDRSRRSTSRLHPAWARSPFLPTRRSS